MNIVYTYYTSSSMLRGELENPEIFDVYKSDRLHLETLVDDANLNTSATYQAIIKTYRYEQPVVLVEEAAISYIEPETSYEHATRNLFIAALALKGDDLFSDVGNNIHFTDGFFTPYAGSQLHIFGQYSIALGYLLRLNTFSDHKPELRMGFDVISVEEIYDKQDESDTILRRRGSVHINKWPKYGLFGRSY